MHKAVKTGMWLLGGLGLLGIASGSPSTSLMSASHPLTRPSSRPITPFLIYYGWIPHQSSALRQWEHSIQGYPVVVLGGGLESPSSEDKGPASDVMRQMPHTTFYGYIDIGVTHGQPHHSIPTISSDLLAWRRIGAQGVLLDCAGPDYGVSQQRLSTAVALAHNGHLRVLVNTFNPAAILHVGLRSTDAWLAENWVVSNGVPDARSQGFNWAELATLKRAHIAVWMTATDKTPPTRSWVTYWIERTDRQVGGSAIAVAGADYSSRSNAVVPAPWLPSTIHRILPRQSQASLSFTEAGAD